MNILGSGIDAINLSFSSKKELSFNENEIKNVLIDLIDIGIYQPRKAYQISNDSINDLIESVREHGILQPIILRCTPSKRFELIAGERRLKAAIALNFNDIPAVIKKIEPQQAFALALIENIQREQLSILEEAEALLRLKNEFLMSTESVALMIGKPRTTVANLIRLASNLTPYGKDIFERGLLEYGHIRCVLALPENIQDYVLNYILEKKLTVRAAENFVSERAYEVSNKCDTLENSEENDLTLEKIDNLINNCNNKFFEKIRFKMLKNGSFRVSMDFNNLESFQKMLVD